MNSVQLLIDRVRLTEKQKLDDLCQWLLGHLHESIGWSVLVQRSKMSNEELHRLFMQHHHMSPMQWISQQREKMVHASATLGQTNLETRHQHG
jgi:transcriptional regulator GlxA family with amidase domain